MSFKIVILLFFLNLNLKPKIHKFVNTINKSKSLKEIDFKEFTFKINELKNNYLNYKIALKKGLFENYKEFKEDYDYMTNIFERFKFSFKLAQSYDVLNIVHTYAKDLNFFKEMYLTSLEKKMNQLMNQMQHNHATKLDLSKIFLKENYKFKFHFESYFELYYEYYSIINTEIVFESI